MSELSELEAKARTGFDLTDPSSHRGLVELAERMLATENVSEASLRAANQNPDAALEYRIATKLAESRQFLRTVEKPVRIGVVFAMWGERKRLQPKSELNPLGEDALRCKLDQLAWACQDTPVSWEIYPVDDGCPEQSANLAKTILGSHAHGSKGRALRLEDYVPSKAGPLSGLKSADDSKKGGAIILGCMKAIESGVDAVVYTDADNSVHLGQLGILAKPWLEGKANIVLGNRKHSDSVLVKSADRWGPGIKVLRHMQRMVGEEIFSRGVRDTQAAFKLFEAQTLNSIIQSPTVYDFSFDTDWLSAAIAKPEKFAQVPFAFVDSEAESASAKQNPMTTWETLLLGLNKSVDRFDLLKTPGAKEMSAVIREEILDYRDLESLIDSVPAELEHAKDEDFGNPQVMSPSALREWIQMQKLAAKHG